MGHKQKESKIQILNYGKHCPKHQAKCGEYKFDFTKKNHPNIKKIDNLSGKNGWIKISLHPYFFSEYYTKFGLIGFCFKASTLLNVNVHRLHRTTTALKNIPDDLSSKPNCYCIDKIQINKATILSHVTNFKHDIEILADTCKVAIF